MVLRIDVTAALFSPQDKLLNTVKGKTESVSPGDSPPLVAALHYTREATTRESATCISSLYSVK